MTTESITAERRSGVDWRRAEFVLTALGTLGFITLPIRITTIYGGLPAHPLFVHVPVILIPATVLAAIIRMVKTEWFSRYGIALAVVSIGAMSSILLTMQAGGALQSALHLQGRAAHLISEHSQAANYLCRRSSCSRSPPSLRLPDQASRTDDPSWSVFVALS